MKPRKHLALILFICFCAFPTVYAQSQGDIVDRLDKALGVSLPDEYQKPVKAFVQSDEIMQYQTAALFTEQFIEEQMKVSWGIDRQNQLLFVWDAIYEQVAEKNFYDGEDGNQKRLDDFEMALDSIEACGKKYKEEFIAYMNKVSAEAKQQSAEARQQSAEARQQSAEARQQSAEARQQSAELQRWLVVDDQFTKINVYIGIIEGLRFYQLRNLATKDEIKTAKGNFELFIQNCKRFDIDYYSLLPIEVLNFYDIETVKACQSSLTYEKAMNQLYDIAIKETIILYNFYQQDPQHVPYEDSIKRLYEDCKKRGIDYRSILLKELGDQKKVDDLLKFYGVE